MLTLDNGYLSGLVDNAVVEEEENAVPILPLDSYLDSYLGYAERESQIVYPYTVNIPRDISYMLKTGDISPLQTFTIDKPPVYKGKPLWTRSSLAGVDLGFGYRNADKKLLSKYRLLGAISDLAGPHMHIAGKSGGGKSVFVDALMSNWITAYSPYELEIYMIDAKISGAGKYISKSGTSMPNIKLIAGTLDSSYVVSVLEILNERSGKLNRLFSTVGTDNLKDFREKTGLTIPRAIVLVDEYQLQYQNASDTDSALLTNEYDKILTAGRAAGVHLVLCTQKFIRELLSKFFHNIEIRATLTCASETSEATLANNLASQCRNVGEAFVNQLGVHEMGKDVCLESTHMFKVPYLPSSEFQDWLQNLIDITSVNLPHIKPLNIYNEDSVLFKKDTELLIDKYGKKDRVVFGSPGFMKNSEVDVYYKDLTFDDAETYFYYAPDIKQVAELANTVSLNQQRMSPNDGSSYYLVSDKSLMKNIEVGTNAKVHKADSKSDPTFMSICSKIYERIAMVKCDEIVFESPEMDASDLSIIKDALISEGLPTTALYVSRVQQYKKYFDNNKSTLTSLLAGYDADTFAINTIYSLHHISPKYINTQVTEDNLPTLFVNFIGIDRIMGIARNPDFNAAGAFTLMTAQSAIGRVCINMFCNSMSSTKTIAKNAMYIVTSNSKNDEIHMDIKLPKELKPELGYLYSRSKGNSIRFKRMSMDI